MALVTIEEATKMIGKKVKALGVCGITEGVTIVGILDRLLVLPDTLPWIFGYYTDRVLRCWVFREKINAFDKEFAKRASNRVIYSCCWDQKTSFPM